LFDGDSNFFADARESFRHLIEPSEHLVLAFFKNTTHSILQMNEQKYGVSPRKSG
jgi:hypothetical protein